MTAVWASDETGWRLLQPANFPDEAALHKLIQETPELLPLSGTPKLFVLGREVRLGTGYADLIAVEPSGRLTVIEVKLARNEEARRAVVSQALAYAAFLHGTDLDSFEKDLLHPFIRGQGHEGILELVSSSDQEGSIQADTFLEGIKSSLASGHFRIVFVLDAAPAELVRLIGYLENIGSHLVIDLVTVTAYEVNGSRVLVPQRVDPERRVIETPGNAPVKVTGQYVQSGVDFAEAIDHSPHDQQPLLRRLYEWASGLEKQGHARLGTYHGSRGIKTLLPYVPGENAGLITIWNDTKSAYIQFWRSVFERRAPNSLKSVEDLISPKTVGQGNTLREISEPLLDVLAEAYREAAGRPL